jgi:hypothetical protein
MTTWNVHVRGAGIAAGVQLDFCLDGFTDHEAVPPLAAGDGLTFIFPSNDRLSGVALSYWPDLSLRIIRRPQSARSSTPFTPSCLAQCAQQ